MTAKKSAAGQDRRPSAALESFEKGVRALGKRDFAKAAELFEALIASHPEERDLVERSRTYLGGCLRALEEGKRTAFRPKDIEETLNLAVYYHNRGEFEEALRVLRGAATAHPQNEHVFYCLAASAARAGDTPAALEALRSAIRLSPASRAQARADSDFDPIRDEDAFIQLVYERAS